MIWNDELETMCGVLHEISSRSACQDIKFPAFYCTRGFINVFIEVWRCILSCASSIQSPHSHPVSTGCSKFSIQKTKHLFTKKYWKLHHFAFNVMSTQTTVMNPWCQSKPRCHLLHVVDLQLRIYLIEFLITPWKIRFNNRNWNHLEISGTPDCLICVPVERPFPNELDTYQGASWRLKFLYPVVGNPQLVYLSVCAAVCIKEQILQKI
jgi:hypothetical protein